MNAINHVIHFNPLRFTTLSGEGKSGLHTQLLLGLFPQGDHITGLYLVGGDVYHVTVHQDGLIHISQLADRFVRDPSEVVKVRQQVTVRVLEVDQKRGRISLSLRDV